MSKRQRCDFIYQQPINFSTFSAINKKRLEDFKNKLMEDFPERRITFITAPKNEVNTDELSTEYAKNFYKKLAAIHNLQASGPNYKDTTDGVGSLKDWINSFGDKEYVIPTITPMHILANKSGSQWIRDNTPAKIPTNLVPLQRAPFIMPTNLNINPDEPNPFYSNPPQELGSLNNNENL